MRADDQTVSGCLGGLDKLLQMPERSEQPWLCDGISQLQIKNAAGQD